MGGQLVTMHMSTEAANLTVGSDLPNLQLVDGDLECQFLQALMLEAGVNTAWVGYRRYQGYGAPEYRHAHQWMELESGQPVDVPWFVDELEPSFTPSFPSWWPYHTVGGFLLATASAESSVTHVASAAQESFPFPFTGVPGYSVKALVNGARVTKEQLGGKGRGFSFEGPDHAREILFDGVPFKGAERVSFYASPVNCGPIHLRLPYICVWDS